MTGENGSPQYLDRRDYEALHAALAAWAAREDEPTPPFRYASEHDIDNLVQTPRQAFGGHALYPTLEEKAAMIFYTINKRQIFLNGNKRMSILALLVFLGINGKDLDVPAGELTAKALWLANTASLDFPVIKEDLVRWVREHLRDDPEAATA